MSRPIRIQFPGAVYHVMSRGNGGHNIFQTNEDYLDFLAVFSDVLKRYNVICYSYCLMPNHYHLLLETPDPNLSIAMRQLNGGYTQLFNIKHKRRGHLFQDRYKSILVDMENYRYEIIRYINLNPVRASLVKSPKAWKWSSHNEIAGHAKVESDCIDLPKTLKLFSKDKQTARKYYLEHLSRKDEIEVMDELKNRSILGSSEFIEKIRGYFTMQSDAKEIPKIERFAHRPSLTKIFSNIGSLEKRNDLFLKANMEYGYTLAEISREVGLHYATISRIIKELRSEIKK